MYKIIVSSTEKGGIGFGGDLPWPRIKTDMKFFKDITTKASIFPKRKNIVIMGRKTWESIPEKFRPLPNRRNFIISKKEQYSKMEDVAFFQDLRSALKEAGDLEKLGFSDDTFIIGGGGIYKEALELGIIDKIYFTRIFNEYKCDTFFPIQQLEKNFTCVEKGNIIEENGVKYCFETYKKNFFK